MPPFDEEDQSEGIITKKKVGVKLSNDGSMINSLPKKSASKEEFVKKATEANETLNEYTVRAADLSLKFKKVLEDKNLSQNKSPFATDSERELLSNLVQLAIDMNTDEAELDGMGSVGLITLLMRAVLIQRDRINQLEYSHSLLDKRMRDVAASVKEKP